ncbi:non-ribosomal peptide synthetase [Klebsiella pneumoniae]|uniref:Non-ribosomal peptide synthetase n=1 Tax=Klebsiella pneumoniae TaxID=573 RepID=A0A378AR80_KLEPN|nr:non-ribosomal peptide synthetase [Klebsiella pneumoniae]
MRAFDYCVNYYNFTYERHIAGAAQRVESYYSGEQSYKLQIVLQTVNNHKESLRLSLEALRSAFHSAPTDSDEKWAVGFSHCIGSAT